MESVLAVLAMAGIFLAGFIVAQIAQRIIVPLLVFLLGQRHFASPSAFDGCTLGLFGGFATILGPLLFKPKRSPFHDLSPLWIFVFIAVGITVYGLGYLWVLGFGGRKREWKFKDERILTKARQELHPTFIRERSDYFQTDAFNGYSHYFLELHDATGLLATNAYTSENEFKRDIARIRKLTDAKRLDLVWSWQVEERKWMLAYFPDEWSLILCGPLDRLPSEDRQWWQQWIYPNFAKHMGAEVDATDALERLNRLEGAYGTDMRAANPQISAFLEKLRRILMSPGPVVVLDNVQFQKRVEKVRGNSTIFMHDGDFAELE